MASATKLCINLACRVSDETIERCLKVLEWWMNDNPDKTIVGEKVMTTDGIITKLKIIPWGVSSENGKD